MSDRLPVSSNQSIESTPRVRIDTQDELFSRPIREFLLSWGCAVFVNTSPDDVALYHFVCGDADFVKQIFTDRHRAVDRTIAIIWNDSQKKIPIQHIIHVRQVLVDPRPLEAMDVQKIFQFFFTETSMLLDIRSPVHILSKSESKITDERFTDKGRIRKLMGEMFDDESKKTKKINPPHTSWWKKMLVLTIIIPTFCYGLAIFGSIGSLALGIVVLKQGNIGLAITLGHASATLGDSGNSIVSFIGFPVVWLGGDRYIRRHERFMTLLTSAGDSFAHVGSLLLASQSFGEELLSTEPAREHPARRIERLQASIAQTRTDLGLAQANLRAIGTYPAVGFLTQSLVSVEDTLIRYRQLLETLGMLMTLYKDMGGFEKPQTYLVLFQNSNELRPTGGFIGSVGTLTFADGKIGEFAIHDVYELDGQLKGHVDPPLPIRTLLSQEHWYLRDSNWDPDFTKSGERAMWFYEKESGSQVDGVIAVSVPFVVDLLAAAGPIELPDYNDRVSADNFFGKLLYYTQTDFFPGSTQKKDFLGSLSRALTSRLTTMQSVNPTRILSAITSALWRHDVLFYFRDPGKSLLVQKTGWSGNSLTQPSCNDTPSAMTCVSLPVAVVDANVGVNKVNYFIRNSLTRDIIVNDRGDITETVVLSQSNESPDESVPGGGTYKSYTRFYLPKTGNVSHVLVDGIQIPFIEERRMAGAVLPYAFIEQSESAMVVGVASILGQKENRQISVSYTLAEPNLFISFPKELMLTTGKQPGVMPMPLSITLTTPSRVHSSATTGKERGDEPKTAVSRTTLVANDGRLEYNGVLAHDASITVTFTGQRSF